MKRAIERGVGYYVDNLFDERGMPKPFSRPPRLIVYRRELYDYAECMDLDSCSAFALKNSTASWMAW